MKTTRNFFATQLFFHRLLPACLALLCLVQAGCKRSERENITPPANTSSRQSKLSTPEINPLRIVLAPHQGDSPLDKKIAEAQQAVRSAPNPDVALERLGWLFVAKARASFDNGFYKLAEQCAFAIESRDAGNANALLLRGHVLHNLHRFKEAEPIARDLAARRGAPMDFGLHGDVLMELGRLDDAINAYQQMMDLRPDSRAYARAAHVRWLKGDVTGAIEAMQEAAGYVGSRDAESAAWMQTRLAFYQFQARQFAPANQSCSIALQLQTNYAPALLLRGRMLLNDGKSDEAIASLEVAARLNPLPEYHWALIEALNEAGHTNRADVVLAALHRSGRRDDPRTYSIYLATHASQPELAVSMAHDELKERADVFTYDSLAWAQLAAGDIPAARENITRALAEGTLDGRLFLHAAVIAAGAGDEAGAKTFSEKTRALGHLLWPSERKHLGKTMTEIAGQASNLPRGGNDLNPTPPIAEASQRTGWKPVPLHNSGSEFPSR